MSKQFVIDVSDFVQTTATVIGDDVVRFAQAYATDGGRNAEGDHFGEVMERITDQVGAACRHCAAVGAGARRSGMTVVSAEAPLFPAVEAVRWHAAEVPADGEEEEEEEVEPVQPEEPVQQPEPVQPEEEVVSPAKKYAQEMCNEMILEAKKLGKPAPTKSQVSAALDKFERQHERESQKCDRATEAEYQKAARAAEAAAKKAAKAAHAGRKGEDAAALADLAEQAAKTAAFERGVADKTTAAVEARWGAKPTRPRKATVAALDAEILEVEKVVADVTDNITAVLDNIATALEDAAALEEEPEQQLEELEEEEELEEPEQEEEKQEEKPKQLSKRAADLLDSVLREEAAAEAAKKAAADRRNAARREKAAAKRAAAKAAKGTEFDLEPVEGLDCEF